VKELNGTVKFLPHRGVYVGYWNGKIQCTKKTPGAARDFLNAKFGVPGAAVPPVVAVTAMRPLAVNLNGTQHTLMSQVEAEWNKAKRLYPAVKDMPTPKVEFYTRGRVAGKAYYMQHKVSFNTVLAAENQTTFLDTVKHELAHLVVHKIAPWAKAHGPEFKRVLINMGGSGERCHNYDVSNVVAKKLKYEYKCGCQTHNMTSVRHNKAQRGGATYRCRKCRAPVVYTGNKVMA
jgi:SprT protein